MARGVRTQKYGYPYKRGSPPRLNFKSGPKDAFFYLLETYSDPTTIDFHYTPHKMPLGIIQSNREHAPGTILLFDTEFHNETRVFKRGSGKVWLVSEKVQKQDC